MNRLAKEELKEILWGIATALAILAVVAGFTYWLNSARCTQRWELSGMESRYTFVAGCMVKLKGGVWVPSSVIRDMPIEGAAK